MSGAGCVAARAPRARISSSAKRIAARCNCRSSATWRRPTSTCARPTGTWPSPPPPPARGATARCRVTPAACLPTFTITGQYGTQSTEWSKWFGSGTNIWQAFAGVSIPVFKEGRPGVGEQVNIARARASQARSRYEQTVLVALREVEDALVGLRTAQDRSGAQERQVIALRRALELADMRYRNGVSSYLDVLDAQRGLF